MEHLILLQVNYQYDIAVPLVTGELRVLQIYYRHTRDRLGNYITVNVQHITGILNTGTLHSGKSKIL